jgi:hypothetical protein
MTDSSKSRLMMALVLATICLPAAAKDPNHPTTGLRFEVGQTTVDWRTTDMFGRSSPLPIKEGLVRPSHRAQLFIANLPSREGNRLDVDFQGPQAIKEILDTPAGQEISPAQRKFLEAGRAIYRDGSLGDEVIDHFRFWVYGVSKDDAEKTTQAFIQFLTAEAEAKMQLWLSECKKLTEDLIPGCKKRISETQDEIKAVQAKLDTLKKRVYYVSTEEAMQTVLEFNKTLNTLEVEVAGLQAKVSANKEYMTQGKLTNEALTKLQQILADHIIELAGALARKETAAKIRDQAKEFYDLHTQLDKLPKDLTNLEKTLSSHERGLEGAEKAMSNPQGGALPPKVFENKVVINPVRTD